MIRKVTAWEVNLYVAGYVTAMQDRGKLLTDVSYTELSPEYREELEALGNEYIERRLSERKTDPIEDHNNWKPHQ